MAVSYAAAPALEESSQMVSRSGACLVPGGGDEPPLHVWETGWAGGAHERAIERIYARAFLGTDDRFSGTVPGRHFLSRAPFRVTRNSDHLAGGDLSGLAAQTAAAAILLGLHSGDAAAHRIPYRARSGLPVRLPGRLGGVGRHAVQRPAGRRGARGCLRTAIPAPGAGTCAHHAGGRGHDSPGVGKLAVQTDRGGPRHAGAGPADFSSAGRVSENEPQRPAGLYRSIPERPVAERRF